MKKALVRLTLCLLIFFGMQTYEDADTRSRFIKLWTEPIEIAYVIPNDGRGVIEITSGLANSIIYKPSVPEILAGYGYEIKDIQIWIHNHLSASAFSQSDLTMYWYLKANGFEGVYMLKNDRGVFYLSPPQGEEK